MNVYGNLFKYSFLLIGLILFQSCEKSDKNSQVEPYESYIEEVLLPLKKENFKPLDSSRHIAVSPFLKEFSKVQWGLLLNGAIDDSIFDRLKSIPRPLEIQKSLYQMALGDYLQQNEKFEQAKIIEAYEKALQSAQKVRQPILISNHLLRICSVYFSSQKNQKELKETLEIYDHYILDKHDQYSAAYFKIGLRMQEGIVSNPIEMKRMFDSLYIKAEATQLPTPKAEVLQLEGVLYDIFFKDYETASKYYALAKKEYKKVQTAPSRNRIKHLEINEAILLQMEGKNNASLRKLDSIKKFGTINKSLREQLTIYRFLKQGYRNVGNYRDAFEMQETEKAIQDSLDFNKQRYTIAQNKSLLKDQENQKLQQQKRDILIGSIALLVMLSVIGTLAYKNMSKKKILAENEKLIQQQQVVTLLKEQELHAIDAMIEGQEKERTRIARELHDDLGGTMANVKLHFNSLQHKNSPELMEKTGKLLDEAYEKVRTVAHAKNSGVLAKQGLLQAVEDMARKTSSTDGLKIEVSHDLDKRLENSLELTLFRIIQELITNIIKHAEAQHAEIHITEHKDFLNIMVTDDGKGFNTEQLNPNTQGMGLSSIQKRVDHLNGKLTIDTILHKGTTIIIDIPLKIE